jgi:iron complex outermembrane receptor protein
MLRTRRKALLLSSAVGGMVFLALAVQPAAAQTDGNEVSELVVTGSRIPRPNLDQPTPTSVLSQAAIRNAGPQNLGDIITRLPEVGYTGTVRANSNNFGNGAGVSSIDLRGLGLSRTLVLVDGHRHVAGDIDTNAVDVNAIPTALVDRVDVITGGASAIYGSDAVSGVVNIILKKKFEGVQADTQIGGYDNGFGAKYSASITAGKNFLGDRLNVAVTGFWNKEEKVDASDLPSAHNYGLISNPADVSRFDPTYYSSGAPMVNNGVPDRLYAPNIGTDLLSRNGVLLNASTFDPQFSFDSQGRLVPAPTRTGYNSFAYGQLPTNCQSCYFPEDYEQEASPLRIRGVTLNANMDFTPHLHGFLDAKVVETKVQNLIQPSFSEGDYQLQPDNAFISPELDAALAGTDAADYPYISRFLNGGRYQRIERRTYRVVAGLSGDFDARFAKVNWSGSLNYGETDTDIRNEGLEITENFAAALDSVIDPATGQAACRINVPSAAQTGFGAGALNAGACVPYNPFGQQNGREVYAYSFGTFGTYDKLTQQVAELNANFDTSRFFNLQGGPIGLAIGGEYRMERTTQTADPMLTSGATENLTSNSAGGFNVYEGYAELSAPIFLHYGPLLDELSVDLAYRGAHYSTVGRVSAYKVSGTYGPASWLKLRGTWSRAVRAPNITEAFLPSSGGYFDVTDPCSSENIAGNVNYAANCQAANIPARFVADTNSSITGTSSGNANLNPERSKSYTLGFVLQPKFVPGLSVTLDYYSIKIKDAITLVTGQQIINNCYNSSAGLNSEYCGLFTRGADNNINSVQTTYVNASKLFTDGFELQVSYSTNVAPLTEKWRYTRALDGRLSLNLTANYVARLRNFPFQSNPSQVNILEGKADVDFGNNPQLKAVADLAYTQGPLTLDWTTRYVGKQALFNRDPTAADKSESRDIPFAEPVFYHDLTVRYRLGEADSGTELFAGVNNLFDEQPPFTVVGTGRDMSYDLGRFIFVGARFRH